jgi:Tol biopolymer transport system component
VRGRFAFLVSVFIAVLSIVASGSAAVTKVKRVSVSSSGTAADQGSITSAISADGRYVAFASTADNLVHGDTNTTYDVFVHDLKTGRTKRASVASSGAEAHGLSDHPSISADGRIVVFNSDAPDLVNGDNNATTDIFVHNMKTGKTRRVSMSSSGAEADNYSGNASISENGRFVAFQSTADNLVPGDTNTQQDVFVRDLKNGKTRRVSVSSAGTEGDGSSSAPSISADGRLVAFSSQATTLVPNDGNATGDIFVNDRKTHRTRRVSVSSSGAEADGYSYNFPSLSANGRFVAFASHATNLVGHDLNGKTDIFLRDLDKKTTKLISVSSSGEQANDDSFLVDPLVVSNDGGEVAFISLATNLLAGGTTGEQVFLRDVKKHKTRLLNVSGSGVQGDGNSFDPSMTPDGRSISFSSAATNLVPHDTQGHEDIFVRSG